MIRIAWLTDLHLDFADQHVLKKLSAEIKKARPDELWVGGDVSRFERLEQDLGWLASRIAGPVRFVLGNHDYYGASIAETEALADHCRGDSTNLQHLGKGEVIDLGNGAALIGHRGWADGRAGNSVLSRVSLNDYVYISDFSGMGRTERFARLADLGAESAKYFSTALNAALSDFSEVWVLTHVPPFPEATWHEGKMSDGNFLPHFCNLAGGDAISAAAQRFPDRQVRVLCGHTHSGGVAQILPNLEVITAGADYGNPRIARIFDLGG